MAELWYFSYGWSLDKSLLKKCIGSWLDARRAVLKGFRLVFNVYSPSWRGGIANLEEDEASEIYGVAYRITSEQLEKLDRFEGVPSRAARRSVLIAVEGIGELKAITHVAVNPRGGRVHPSREYLSAMYRGVKQHGLGEDALRLIRRAAGTKIP
ncbi:MAG: gamma-glutamylcyclotransferase [Thaumarchaeota archaeon]|nr:gamma-glutamylcyclotransferase [Nitrososphaerota archaeon]